MKPRGYELVDLPYDYFCPSVQKKLKKPGGDMYRCKLNSCKKSFTTLALTTKHLQLTVHAEISARNMFVQPDSDDKEDSGDKDADEEGALIIPKDGIGRFISSQFEDDS